MSRLSFPSRLRAVPFGLLVTTALVAMSAAFAVDPVRDAATLGAVGEATLRRPTSYLLLSPISNVLDTLTLMSVRQHIAFVLTLGLVHAGVRWVAWRTEATEAAHATPGRRALGEAARVGVGLLLLVALYAAVAIMPRPMAALEAGADILVVDFHSHTQFSHDGRPGWGAEKVRAWHRAAGYDVAYVTDHRTFEGARDSWANNSARAGEGTFLLPGLEVVWRGEHVNVLDADRMYRGLFNETLRDIDDKALTLASLLPGAEPVLIETVPADLSKVVGATGRGTAGVRAIELVDGAPRGLGQTRNERERIVRLADSMNLALVAGSDHHGWGHAAAGWTLLVLPRWRAVASDQLSSAISGVIRIGGRQATRVVARYLVNTESGVALPLTVPLVAWGMLRSLSNDERIVWFAWLGAALLLWRVLAARRRDRA